MSATASLRKIPSAFLATQVDDELILVHGKSGAFYSIKDTGLAIWEALDETADLAGVAQRLEQSFDVSSDVCRSAVEEFSGQLVAAGFAEFT